MDTPRRSSSPLMLMLLMMLSLGIGVGYLVFHKPTPAPTPREAFEATEKLLREAIEATEKLLSAWDKDIKGSRADHIRILISEGADVNAKDDHGNTPLLLAAWFSKTPEIVTLLIEAGADVNGKSDSGSTPLMIAAYNESPETVRLLIEAGADVNAKNDNGQTSLEAAEEMWELYLWDEDSDDNYDEISKYEEIIKLLKAAGAKE